jgi:hypothetical protein
VRIHHAGKWNLLGGPDFKGARIAFGDAGPVVGDVELHLRAVDWNAHGHARDPAYDNVILHVVLFPPDHDHGTHGANGRDIPVLVLLPLLHHDLEEFAADEAVEHIAGHGGTGVPEELALMESGRLLGVLREHAVQRWKRKVHFAHVRLHRLGWESACHHAALEILGYRFNRSPMLRIAGRWPLPEWATERLNLESIYESERGCWSLQGVRPANLPRTRLRQYAAWTRSTPCWPNRFAESAAEFFRIADHDSGLGTREMRRRYRLAEIRERIRRAICGDAIAGTRLDNLICDGLLPLHAAKTQPTDYKILGSVDFEIWFHWFPGDQPPPLMRALRQLGVCDGRDQPGCHGFAQGLFGWFIELDTLR